MPQPVSPVVVGLEPYEIVLGKDQPEYLPLPVLRSAAPYYSHLSRWKLTPEERMLIAEGADVYVTISTFGQSYPPTAVTVMRAEGGADEIRESMQLDEELSQRLLASFATIQGAKNV
jgi:hypothetical protein